MNRKLTRAAVAAAGFSFLIFGYQQAFGLGRAGIGYELVGMLFMAVGIGILVAMFLYYRDRDKQ